MAPLGSNEWLAGEIKRAAAELAHWQIHDRTTNRVHVSDSKKYLAYLRKSAGATRKR